mgnify:CR=1 FL=1
MRIFFKIWSFRGSLIKVLGRRQRPDVRRAECGCTSTNVCCHLDTFSFWNSNWCWIWGGRGRIRPFGCAQIWWHSCQLGKWQGRSNPIDTHYCPLRILIKFQSTRRTRVQASGLKHEEMSLNCSQFWTFRRNRFFSFVTTCLTADFFRIRTKSGRRIGSEI